MDKRVLGSGSLEVSALGFGCIGMSQSFGPNPGDRGEMMNLLRAAIDLGVTFFDTAEVYGPFVNEELGGQVPPNVARLNCPHGPGLGGAD